MKSRNREINIFNMSLLDILCGALGAFCFMMIVLLPYYKPGGPVDAKRQQEMEKSVKELEDLKKQISDPKLAQELEDLIKKLRAQIKELEGRVNSLTQENKQLADQNQQLQQKNKELADKNKQLSDQLQQVQAQNQQLQAQNNQLQQRRPGVIIVNSLTPIPGGLPAILDLLIWTPTSNTVGKNQPPFDPNLIVNSKFFGGDAQTMVNSSVPTTLFLYRDIPTGLKQNIYVKLHPIETHPNAPATQLPLPAPMKVTGILLSGSPDTFVKLPEVELTPQHPWMLMGYLNTDPDGNVKYIEATPAEREQEWRKLDKPHTSRP